ncbi:MAG: transposase [Actinomycetota bacterium]|nr:transposase [Actinomycetota bacterium]
MLLDVPASLDGLLVLLRPCFSQPSFQTFRAMVVGQVCQTGLRTVTGMLVGARLSGVWHHARAHRFFSHARWSPDELGLRLAELIAARLAEPGAALPVAIDDTLLHRLGRRVYGTFWHHDATANSRQAAVAWGNNWVVLGIVVRLGFLERAVCLPVLFRLWRPRRPEYAKANKPDPERPGKPELAREMTDLLAARISTRTIHSVADAAYATGASRGLAGRVTMTSRLRSNAAIYAPKPPRTGKRGQPAKWGKRLPSLAQIATDATTIWTQATVRCYQKTETLMLAEIDCLWGPLGAETPVRVILVGDASRTCGYQIALITTDLTSTPAQIVERYADRWPIEVAYEDAKHVFGVGHARNRTRKAVERTAPFQFLTMTLTVVWYALHGHHPDDVAQHRARAPWYLSKTNPSTADMLAKLRRTIIAAQYHPRRGATPTPAVFTQVQHAWAAAGL